ncbi:unnamed protein product [Macrosiphum euphorbiae]|uniref:Uncharacterized protein n=1 Tax=Macrosiphum euphorbiae TaxID=13131 RepID=A0AAV0VNL0_9HEMI|nr:unnamed protein product [Macrosiphum euphorbiae]
MTFAAGRLSAGTIRRQAPYVELSGTTPQSAQFDSDCIPTMSVGKRTGFLCSSVRFSILYGCQPVTITAADDDPVKSGNHNLRPNLSRRSSRIVGTRV